MSWHLPMHIFFFPGMIVHELSHYLACLFVGVKVHETKFWGKDEAYVRHSMPNAVQGIIITIAPFVVCNLLALEMLKTANSLLPSSIISIIYYWFALSLLYFCFPSDADAKNSLDAFTSFYKTKVLQNGSIISRFLWLLTFPFLFTPLVLMLGMLMLFGRLLSLRLIWIFSVLIFSVSPDFLIAVLSAINKILLRIAQIFI